MKKENLDDFALPYVDFYLEIPHSDTDYLNDIHHGIHDDHEQSQDGAGLSEQQVSELRRDSLDAVAKEPVQAINDEHGLFSSDDNN